MVGTPKVAAWYAPPEFHGTRLAVTVALSSMARDRFLGCSPLSLYDWAYILPVITMDIYWSQRIRLEPMAVRMVAVIKDPVDWAFFNMTFTTTRSWLVFSIMPPNIMAQITSDTVYIMDSKPPLVNRLSTASTPLLLA